MLLFQRKILVTKENWYQRRIGTKGKIVIKEKKVTGEIGAKEKKFTKGKLVSKEQLVTKENFY